MEENMKRDENLFPLNYNRVRLIILELLIHS